MIIKWWQSTVIGIVIFLVGIGTGYILHRPQIPIIFPTPAITIGKPDTTYSQTIPIKGKHVYEHVVGDTTNGLSGIPAPGINNKLFYSKTTDSTINTIHFVFRSTTYPYVDSTGRATDSAYIVHEWNIQPIPQAIVVRMDTLRIMVPVSIPAQVPFYSKPSFIFPVGIVTGIVATLIIARNIK